MLTRFLKEDNELINFSDKQVFNIEKINNKITKKQCLYIMNYSFVTKDILNGLYYYNICELSEYSIFIEKCFKYGLINVVDFYMEKVIYWNVNIKSVKFTNDLLKTVSTNVYYTKKLNTEIVPEKNVNEHLKALYYSLKNGEVNNVLRVLDNFPNVYKIFETYGDNLIVELLKSPHITFEILTHPNVRISNLYESERTKIMKYLLDNKRIYNLFEKSYKFCCKD